MNDSNSLANFLQYIQFLFAHAKSCVNIPINNYECKGFWLRLDVVFMIVVVYLIIRIVIYFIQSHWAYKDHILWLEGRDRVADKETMNKFKWTEQDSAIDELSLDEAAKVIRQNLQATEPS